MRFRLLNALFALSKSKMALTLRGQGSQSKVINVALQEKDKVKVLQKSK